MKAIHGRVAHAVIADATRPDVVEQLGLALFDRVVIAIGTDVTASILVASQLLRAGATDIWAKAVDERHAIILEQLGIAHVVRPEADMGRRVAHMVRGSLEGYVEIEPGYAAVKLPAPEHLLGKPLRELGVHARGPISVVAVQREGEWIHANQETRFAADDRVLIAGPPERLDAFAAQAKRRR